MIFRKDKKQPKIKIIENIEEILKSNQIKFYNFNKKEESSYCFLKQNNNLFEQRIEIGIKDLSVFYNENWVFVQKIVDTFHEIEHFYQHQNLYNFIEKQSYLPQRELEVCCSIILKSKYQGIEKLKYTMLPSELDAELYGILEAKAYFEEKHPSIDFNKHLLEYVNNVERWYGPNPLKGDRPVFTSFEEVVAYLYANLEIAYNYPVPIEYDGFDSKLESIRVANLDSGAEQFYLIARDLYRKKFVNEITLDATKELTDYYSKDKDRETGNEKDTKCFENEVNKEDTVDDVLLSTSAPSFKQPPASKQGLSIPIATMDKQTPFVDFLDVDK